MNGQVNATDIGAIFKQALDIIQALPPTNQVLREKAIAATKEAHKVAMQYWAHQNATSQLASEQPETEEEAIRRIVAPYIKKGVGNTVEIRGKQYKGELSMNVMEMHAREILAEQAAKGVGIQTSASATEGASEEATGKKKSSQHNAAPKPPTSTTPPSDSNTAGDAAEFRNLGDLFTDGNVAGSLFGETVLGSDNGETAAQKLNEALKEIENTTSAASLQRGDTGGKIAEYAICLIAWMLGIIESEDINISSPSGLYQFQVGKPLPADKRLAKKNLVEAIFARLRPEMEKKETHKNKSSKTKATPTTEGDGE